MNYRVDLYRTRHVAPEMLYFESLNEACEFSWASAKCWKALIFKRDANSVYWISL